MNACSTAGRLLVGVAVMFLLGACATGASPTTAPASPSPSSVPSAAATPSVIVTSDLAYESSKPVFEPGMLAVYAPTKAGPWPVVVLLPPVGMTAFLYGLYARPVADLGFVVFVPTWGAGMSDAPAYDQTQATDSQAACAVEYAAAHAAEYGGDPTTLIVFGHSSGANTAAMVAFAHPEPSAGCLVGATPGAIDALITWDGDWMLQTTFMGWDELLAADPRVFDALTPWTYLAEHKDLKVVMLGETEANADYDYDRPLPDQPTTDAYFAPRDPSGVLRRQLEANGALADGNLDVLESQQLLYSLLHAQGNPVSLDILLGSNHIHLSEAGWKVFLAAFPKAAARD
jgi:pimeloyl-ACP methyl ester carboxylesterase